MDNRILAEFIRIHEALSIVDLVEERKWMAPKLKNYNPQHYGCNFSNRGCENEGLWMIEAGEDEEDLWSAASFACEEHFDAERFDFAKTLLERKLDRERDYIDEVEDDEEADLEHDFPTFDTAKEVVDYLRRCSVCGGEGEHDWEVHVAEMKAGY